MFGKLKILIQELSCLNTFKNAEPTGIVVLQESHSLDNDEMRCNLKGKCFFYMEQLEGIKSYKNRCLLLLDAIMDDQILYCLIFTIPT